MNTYGLDHWDAFKCEWRTLNIYSTQSEAEFNFHEAKRNGRKVRVLQVVHADNGYIVGSAVLMMSHSGELNMPIAYTDASVPPIKHTPAPRKLTFAEEVARMRDKYKNSGIVSIAVGAGGVGGVATGGGATSASSASLPAPKMFGFDNKEPVNTSVQMAELAMLREQVAQLTRENNTLKHNAKAFATARQRLSFTWEHLEDVATPLPVQKKAMPENALRPKNPHPMMWMFHTP